MAVALLLVAGGADISACGAWLRRLLALGYGALLMSYTFWFKHLVILDVIVGRLGFVLRASTGAPRPWQ